jgi:predicted nucleotide-binding protein
MSDSRLDEPSADVIALTRLIWQSFRGPDNWPTIRDIDRAADRHLDRDLASIVTELPRWWLWPDLSRNFDRLPLDTEIFLTIESISELAETRPIGEATFRIIKEIVAIEASFEPEESGQDLVVYSYSLARHLNLSPATVSALPVIGDFIVHDFQGIWRGMSRTPEGDWNLTVDERGIRGYREINSLDELIAANIAFRETPVLPSRVRSDASLHEEAAREDADSAVRATDDASDPTYVFLVHGRNMRAREAMVQFLESLGLTPLDVQRDLVPLTGEASPPILDAIIQGFRIAKAVVILLTPDEESRLRAELADGEDETRLVFQSRPNVYFEAGYAFSSHPDRTVLVELGRTNRLSDIANLLAVPMDNSEYSRLLLMERLAIAGCSPKTSSDAWKSAGDFDAAIAFVSPDGEFAMGVSPTSDSNE